MFGTLNFFFFFFFTTKIRIKATKCNSFPPIQSILHDYPSIQNIGKNGTLERVLLFHFLSFGPLLETNKPLLGHFISFRGYRTDWVSTTVAVEAYGSKGTVEKNLRGRRCNRKNKNNSAGLTRGTIQFVMWNHGLSAAQWQRVLGDSAQESSCEKPRVSAPTGYSGFLSLADLATINLFLHQCGYTGAERPVQRRPDKNLCLVSWDGLVPDVPWGVRLSWGTITVRWFWCFPSLVMDSYDCWKLLNHVDMELKKQLKSFHQCYASCVDWEKYCIVFSSHCKRFQGLMKGEETVDHEKDTDHKLQCHLILLIVTSLSIKHSMRKTSD